MTPALKAMVDENDVRWCVGENGLYLEFEFLDDQGDVEIRGSHKWDGCVNWETSETCMAHFCGVGDAQRLMARFLTVARIAQREIARYDEHGDWPGERP